MRASGANCEEYFAMSVMLRISSHIVEESAFARVYGHEYILLK